MNQTVQKDIVSEDKSKYFDHFMEQVMVIKECIRNDIDGYKHQLNDERVQDFLHLTQRLKNLIQFVLKNIDN